MYLQTVKNWLHFGTHLHLNLNSGIYWRILQLCEVGHFLQSGSYHWKKWSDLRESFITDVSLDKEGPLNFGSHQDPGSEFRPDLPWLRSVLIECTFLAQYNNCTMVIISWRLADCYCISYWSCIIFLLPNQERDWDHVMVVKTDQLNTSAERHNIYLVKLLIASWQWDSARAWRKSARSLRARLSSASPTPAIIIIIITVIKNIIIIEDLSLNVNQGQGLEPQCQDQGLEPQGQGQGLEPQCQDQRLEPQGQGQGLEPQCQDQGLKPQGHGQGQGQGQEHAILSSGHLEAKDMALRTPTLVITIIIVVVIITAHQTYTTSEVN